tara:strand:- start:355 stop:510 length:156 start_codon:yes stop_codon:yes gene_type:complete
MNITELINMLNIDYNEINDYLNVFFNVEETKVVMLKTRTLLYSESSDGGVF